MPMWMRRAGLLLSRRLAPVVGITISVLGTSPVRASGSGNRDVGPRSPPAAMPRAGVEGLRSEGGSLEEQVWKGASARFLPFSFSSPRPMSGISWVGSQSCPKDAEGDHHPARVDLSTVGEGSETASYAGKRGAAGADCGPGRAAASATPGQGAGERRGRAGGARS